ncbi:hypothetical protein [Micromonospora sp. NPDC005299]|uniref:hypothetical protein n=1 Tax=Micromonospora sp. NPDC005299 TaxID=3364231 RepID=UPI00368CB806
MLFTVGWACRATPPATEKSAAAVPPVVHACPEVAVPQPLLTVRANVSSPRRNRARRGVPRATFGQYGLIALRGVNAPSSLSSVADSVPGDT